jgi:hypothetical protein
LTVKYVENQMRLYRTTRQRVKEFLEDVRSAGYAAVRVVGDTEIADVCQLTCLEQGFEVVEKGDVPRLSVRGYEVFLELPQETQ